MARKKKPLTLKSLAYKNDKLRRQLIVLSQRLSEIEDVKINGIGVNSFGSQLKTMMSLFAQLEREIAQIRRENQPPRINVKAIMPSNGFTDEYF